MKKRRKRFVLVSILVFLLAVVFYRILIFKQEERKRVLKVGFYDNYPYFYINDKAKVCGDYNEIVKSLSKRLNFKVEYVNCSLLELLKELENGEIDLVVGINKTPEREKLFEFSKNCINEKKYSIYTNENIKYGNLEALNGKKMGYIKNELDNEKILNYLKSRNINVELVNGSSYKGIKTLLIDDKVDFIVDNSDSDIKNKGKDIKEIFQFSSGPKYIITNKNNKELISEIDQGLNSINVEQDNNNILDYKNFNKFFNDDINKHIFIIFALIVFSILFKKERKKLTSVIKKKRIINNLKKDNYTLYYQPIVDFKHNRVRSVEALLRLRKDGKLLTPYHFMKGIEDANMMKEITLWVLKRVIKDYNIIRCYDNINEKDFYISLNVSFNEIKDREFLKKIVKIVNDNKIIKNSICLEIIEKFVVDEIEKIQENINFLQDNGILIAIDDFGVEYSNLDLLKKIDSNIIKIDKFFADGINDSEISLKVIDFILDICRLSDKSIIIEGVEEKEQVDIIKTFLYEKIYIQGYYFSKPLDIESLKAYTF
ncbi:TPA: EAL domain-containing protein [Clostridium perfringens]|uniref:EAL domain-containing protein n=2 Tax=Clostridium perfringens TaxID=1502 RepID=UPI000665CFF4|nr:EAL domain-containing protein [Clostridium perfringens]MBX9098576.1 EAL domain-containing protein [Clostridium perfringens]MDB2041260.1 EAL domain-containing protein [Clostridium perfringens]MDB2050086.1 EAL domain-containing protein [Clostridium perfringens]MDK0638604.1 EAL domain-containing protein [Clostridium perfringens]MDK0726544.1 EAL domain-containing protein [Clostridium perfringens]